MSKLTLELKKKLTFRRLLINLDTLSSFYSRKFLIDFVHQSTKNKLRFKEFLLYRILTSENVDDVNNNIYVELKNYIYKLNVIM